MEGTGVGVGGILADGVAATGLSKGDPVMCRWCCSWWESRQYAGTQPLHEMMGSVVDAAHIEP